MNSTTIPTRQQSGDTRSRTQTPRVGRSATTARTPGARREVLRPAGRAGQPERPLAFAEPFGLRAAPQRHGVVEPGWLHEPVAFIEPGHVSDRLVVIEPIRPMESVPSRRREHAAVRLTRRGQIVLVLAALMAVVAVGMVAGASATTPTWSTTATEMHVVQPGETLWGLALEAGVDLPTRDVVDRIEEMNGLDSAMLEPGQELRVPVAG